jgi:hypothetical protein
MYNIGLTVKIDSTVGIHTHICPFQEDSQLRSNDQLVWGMVFSSYIITLHKNLKTNAFHDLPLRYSKLSMVLMQ